jgi:hypothetical protein
MLQNEKTVKDFGYSIDSLSDFSNKKIIVNCDYCDNIIIKSYKSRNIQNSILDKDCCNSCKFKKREELSLLKYGVKNSSQRSEIKSKLSNYNIEDYKDRIIELNSQGYSMQNISCKLNIPKTSLNRYVKTIPINVSKNDIQSKKNKTLIEKYGENCQQLMSEKRKKTNLNKFGYENPFQDPNIKTKIKNNNLEKLGVEHHSQDPQNQEKKKKTNIQRYGHDNVAKIPEIQAKIKQTNLEVYGYEHATQNIDIKHKIVSTMIKNGNANYYNNKTSKEWAEQTGYCVSRFNQLVNDYGFEIASKMERGNKYTSLEQSLKLFLEELKTPYEQQFRIKYSNDKTYISDFKINNLLIECDGLYWHSDSVQKDNKYHSQKKQVYDNNNYESLFFREDELRDKSDIVKSIISNKLNLSNRIYARKCEIVKLSNLESDKFFTDNHLMGKGKGDTFCLKYEDQPVCCIRIKKLKDQNYEISRFCNKINMSVVGGFSKLLNSAIVQIKPSSVITFIDRRYGGKGDYLTKLGFSYIHTFNSFKWTDGQNSFHRLQFPGNSGYGKNLYKIWDCGQAKWVLNVS